MDQGTKLRPILNLSAPPGLSFNDSIDKDKMPKVTMATSRQIADIIIRKGKGCYLAKIDQVDAYKLVPVKIDQLRTQGFYWLGRYFCENQLIFGGSSSVPLYDCVHDVIIDLVAIQSQPEQDSIQKCLDDAIFVTKTYEENQKIYSTYKAIANQINLPLASEQNPDKAFSAQTSGKILGIIFDTNELKWSIDEQKANKFSRILLKAIHQRRVTKKTLQSVMGIINTIVRMCPSLRFFRSSILYELKRSYKLHCVILRPHSILSLYNWLRVTQSLKNGLPLGKIHNDKAPANVLTFTTDAAGVKKDSKLCYKIGAAAVQSIHPSDNYIWAVRALWPDSFISNTFDSNGKFCGAKSTTLEMLAIILPLFHRISLIVNNTILIQTDNKAVYYAFRNGRSKIDPWASLILESIMFVANSLPCKIYVEHVPRCSTNLATMADHLSRSDKKGMKLTETLKISANSSWPPSILQWMSSPHIDYNLPSSLLQDFLVKLGTLFPPIFCFFYEYSSFSIQFD